MGGYFKLREESGQTAGDRALTFIIIAVFMLALVGSALLALRNLRLGRGDRRGAFRLALFLFAAWMLDWAFGAHHTGSPVGEFTLLVEYLKSSVFAAAFLWLLYAALEPFLRRRWPHRIIGWSRLLAGGWRDPLVGRDVLIGAAAGAGLIFTNIFMIAAPRWLGQAPDLHLAHGVEALGVSHFVPALIMQITAGTFMAFVLTFLLLLLFIALRRAALAAAAEWLVVTAAFALASNELTALNVLSAAASGLIMVGTIYRYGLLAAVSMTFVIHLFVFYPITSEFTAWYAGGFLPALAICAALALYGFHTSLGGQPLFKRGLLEE